MAVGQLFTAGPILALLHVKWVSGATAKTSVSDSTTCTGKHSQHTSLHGQIDSAGQQAKGREGGRGSELRAAGAARCFQSDSQRHKCPSTCEMTSSLPAPLLPMTPATMAAGIIETSRVSSRLTQGAIWMFRKPSRTTCRALSSHVGTGAPARAMRSWVSPEAAQRARSAPPNLSATSAQRTAASPVPAGARGAAVTRHTGSQANSNHLAGQGAGDGGVLAAGQQRHPEEHLGAL